MPSKTVYLSLGSNLGDRSANIERALTLLTEAGIRVVRRSSLYETEPQGLRDQPWFLNMVAKCETSLFPRRLLTAIQRIELELGRKRLIPNGPRTLDIDILLYGSAVIETNDLIVPHPRMDSRRFVLEPLAELVPELRHPITRVSIREMCNALPLQAVKRVD